LLVGLIIIGLGRVFRGHGSNVNLHLIVSSGGESPIDLDLVLETLKGVTSKLRLQRFDENSERMEASFLVEFDDLSALQSARDRLRELSTHVEITFLDNSGVF
jgi:hypothetical protein